MAAFLYSLNHDPATCVVLAIAPQRSWLCESWSFSLCLCVNCCFLSCEMWFANGRFTRYDFVACDILICHANAMPTTQIVSCKLNLQHPWDSCTQHKHVVGFWDMFWQLWAKIILCKSALSDQEPWFQFTSGNCISSNNRQGFWIFNWARSNTIHILFSFFFPEATCFSHVVFTQPS